MHFNRSGYLRLAGVALGLLTACAPSPERNDAEERGQTPVELTLARRVVGEVVESYRYNPPAGTGPAIAAYGRGYVLPATDGVYLADGTAESLQTPLFVPFESALDPEIAGLPTAVTPYEDGFIIAYERAAFLVGAGGANLEHLLSYDALETDPIRNITNLLVLYVDANPYLVLTGTSSIRTLDLTNIRERGIQEVWGTSVVLYDLTRREVVTETESNRISFDSESPCHGVAEFECASFIVGHDFEEDEVCRIVRAGDVVDLDCAMQEGDSTMDLSLVPADHPLIASTLAVYEREPNPDAVYVVSAAIEVLYLGEWDVLEGTLRYFYMHRAPERSFSRAFHWGMEFSGDYVLASTGGYGIAINRVLGIQRFSELTVYRPLDECDVEMRFDGDSIAYRKTDCLEPVERIDVGGDHGLRSVIHLRDTRGGTVVAATSHLSAYMSWFDRLDPVEGTGLERYLLRGERSEEAPAWWRKATSDDEGPFLQYLFVDA